MTGNSTSSGLKVVTAATSAAGRQHDERCRLTPASSLLRPTPTSSTDSRPPIYIPSDGEAYPRLQGRPVPSVATSFASHDSLNVGTAIKRL